MKSLYKHLTMVVAPLMCAGLLACSSCAKQDTNPTLVVPAPVAMADASADVRIDKTITIVQNGGKYTLPSSDWEPLLLEDDAGINETPFINHNEQTMAYLVDEPFAGTTQDFVLEMIRDHENKGVIFSALTNIVIHNNQFIMTVGHKNANNAMGSTVYAWMLVKNKTAYTFICGGPSGNAGQKLLCESIAQTLDIK
jgi:hypothetical protein